MTNFMAIGMPSGPELILVLVILLLFFGAKRLPELSRSLGKSISEFKRGREEGLPGSDTSRSAQDDETPPSA